MKLIYVLLLVFSGLLSQPVQAQWRLLFQSQDFRQPPDGGMRTDTLDPITAIESRGVLSKYLIVHYRHSRRRLVAKDSIWGFVDGYGVIWRSYEKELFVVTDVNGGWVSYAINRPVRTRLSAMYWAPMYSRTLDSRIKSSWSEAMADIPAGHILR